VRGEREPEGQPARPAAQVDGVVGGIELAPLHVLEIAGLLGVRRPGQLGVAVEQGAGVERREEPLVRVDDERVAALDAVEPVAHRRRRQRRAAVRPIDAEEAARALEGGTYAAGELRRYWPFAASLALGTGLGPVHPPVPEGALEAASLLPCSELLLPTWTGLRLADALITAEAPR